MRADIKVEDIHRQSHGRAGIGYIHDSRDMALYRRTRQQEVDLVIVVAYRTR